MRLVAAHDGRIVRADLAAEVTLELEFPADRLGQFDAALRQASASRLSVTCGTD